MAVCALTALLTVHEYSPASSLLAGEMIRDPALIVMRVSEDRAEPPLPQTTLTSEPADQLQLSDTFAPSRGRGGGDKLTPFTASEDGQQGQGMEACLCLRHDFLTHNSHFFSSQLQLYIFQF